MPALDAADLAQIRSRPIGRRFKLYVYQPENLWIGQVGGAPVRGDRDLTVTTVAGNAGVMPIGCTIRVTTAAGLDRDYPSKVRYRNHVAGPPDILTVADNNIDWANGDLLYGMRLMEIWPRHLYIDVTDPDPLNWEQYKDRDVAWVDDDFAQGPKANGGPAAIGNLVGGQCDLTFVDTGSFSVPGGGAVASRQWIDHGGTPAVVAGGILQPTVTYRYTTAGFYYVELRVWDANGEWDGHYIPVIVDDGTLAVSYSFPGERYWDRIGWVLGTDQLGLVSDSSQFYDGAPTFLVADDRQVATSAFAENRTNLRWSGWLMQDTTERSYYDRQVKYRAVSSCHVMQHIPAYPIGLNSGAEPTGNPEEHWYWLTDLSTDSATFHLLRWHSTVARVCGWHPTGEWLNRAITGEECTSNDLYNQVNAVLHACVADLRCDRQGILRSMRHEWYLSAAEEAARATVMTLTNIDWAKVTYGPRRHHAIVREVTARGVDGAGNDFHAGSPGEMPLDGGVPDEFTLLGPTGQVELNQWAAQHLSMRNWNFTVTLQMPGEFDVLDPARGEYVIAPLTAYDPKLPAGNMSIVGVRFRDDYINGYCLGEWELLPDPSAYGGYGSETIPIPPPPEPPPPPDPPEEPPEPPVPPPEYEWPDVCIYPTRLGGVWYTLNFSGDDIATQPTWAQIMTGGVWPGDDALLDFACDTDDPFSNMYALTATNEDLIKYNGTTWTNSLTKATYQNPADPLYCGSTVALMRSIFVDQMNDNVWAIVTGGAGGTNKVITTYKSMDDGASWTRYVHYTGQAYTVQTNIMAYDGHVLAPRIGLATWIGQYTVNAGAAWNVAGDIGSLIFTQRYFVPMHTTRYIRRGYSGGFNIWEDAWGAITLRDGAPSVWDSAESDSPHKMWGNLNDALHYRIVSGNHLYTTLDTWATNTDRGLLQIPGYNHPSAAVDVAGIAYRVSEEYDEDRIVYFSNDPNATFPHCIFVAYGETDVTPEQKSGNDPATPDGFSIPQSAGGCAVMSCPWLFYSVDITVP